MAEVNSCGNEARASGSVHDHRPVQGSRPGASNVTLGVPNGKQCFDILSVVLKENSSSFSIANDTSEEGDRCYRTCAILTAYRWSHNVCESIASLEENAKPGEFESSEKDVGELATILNALSNYCKKHRIRIRKASKRKVPDHPWENRDPRQAFELCRDYGSEGGDDSCRKSDTNWLHDEDNKSNRISNDRTFALFREYHPTFYLRFYFCQDDEQWLPRLGERLEKKCRIKGMNLPQPQKHLPDSIAPNHVKDGADSSTQIMINKLGDIVIPILLSVLCEKLGCQATAIDSTPWPDDSAASDLHTKFGSEDPNIGRRIEANKKFGSSFATKTFRSCNPHFFIFFEKVEAAHAQLEARSDTGARKRKRDTIHDVVGSSSQTWRPRLGDEFETVRRRLRRSNVV